MPAKPLHNETELLAKVAGGDQRAFRIIYEYYGGKTYLFAMRILNSDVLAEEVMQLTMLKLWQLGEELKEINNLDAYLNTITRNTCYNVIRRRKLEHQANEYIRLNYSDVDNDTEELIKLNETKKVLQDAIDALPQYHRAVYQLCHQEGLKYEEAAERLNLSKSTVQTYMKLSLRFLRNHLAKNGDIGVLIIIFKLF